MPASRWQQPAGEQAVIDKFRVRSEILVTRANVKIRDDFVRDYETPQSSEHTIIKRQSWEKKPLSVL